ncbi:MAG: hypothetical protein R3F43_19145 [bacterium]
MTEGRARSAAWSRQPGAALRGWACFCGARLPMGVDPQHTEQATCPDCARRYRRGLAVAGCRHGPAGPGGLDRAPRRPDGRRRGDAAARRPSPRDRPRGLRRRPPML